MRTVYRDVAGKHVQIRWIPLVGDALVDVSDMLAILDLDAPPAALVPHLVTLPPFQFVQRPGVEILLAEQNPLVDIVKEMVGDMFDGPAPSMPKPSKPSSVLRMRTQCPGCGVHMSFHNALYKHKCRGNAESKRMNTIASLNARMAVKFPAVADEASLLQAT